MVLILYEEDLIENDSGVIRSEFADDDELPIFLNDQLNEVTEVSSGSQHSHLLLVTPESSVFMVSDPTMMEATLGEGSGVKEVRFTDQIPGPSFLNDQRTEVEVIEVSSGSQYSHLLPMSPESSVFVVSDPAMMGATPGRTCKPAKETEVSSPVNAHKRQRVSKGHTGPLKKGRCLTNVDMLHDSGSDGTCKPAMETEVSSPVNAHKRQRVCKGHTGPLKKGRCLTNVDMLHDSGSNDENGSGVKEVRFTDQIPAPSFLNDQLTEVTEVSSGSQYCHLLPESSVVVNEPAMMEATPGGTCKPAKETEVSSPVNAHKRQRVSKGHTGPLKKGRCLTNVDMLHDSGSNGTCKPALETEVSSPVNAHKRQRVSKGHTGPLKKGRCLTNVDMLHDSGSNGTCKPALETEVSSPVNAHKRQRVSKGHTGPLKKGRCLTNVDMLHDSGSDGDEFDDRNENCNEDAEYNNEDNDLRMIRTLSQKLRTNIIAENEKVEEETEAVEMEKSERSDGMIGATEDGEWVNARQANKLTAAAPVDDNFFWSKDFSSFVGQKEVYSRVPGPKCSSQDPVNIFLEIWDLEFMETIVRESNLYAWEVFAQFSDPNSGTMIPAHLDSWTDITVEELYRYFAVLVMMSFCHRSRIRDYWVNGILGMPEFRKVMSRNRFENMSRFLHFVSNGDLSSRGQDRKIKKIAPVIDHCNRKFAALYTPGQYLSLDESLLLWKGRLSWKQCIRSKATRFGIKSFELCESTTGYLLQYRLYTGKQAEIRPDSLYGFQGHTAKVVLNLIDGYLDVGHVLVMDNWYNQLSLTRFLKTRRTDVLGTLNRRRNGMPTVIKELVPNQVSRGSTISRHSGDISLVTWKDAKLVTIMSTYHQDLMVKKKRVGQEILMPCAVKEYNKHMGGVDLKDQKLSMFFMERKRGSKWYIKVFKKLFNTSLLNAYIIYTKNPMSKVYTHREFRFKVAEGLLSRYPLVSPGPSRPSRLQKGLPCVRLEPGNHFPIYTETTSQSRSQSEQHKRLRCVRCYALKQRVTVRTLCELCNVPLCLGKCWRDYHTLTNWK